MTSNMVRHEKEDTLIHLLRQIKEVFDKHGIEFWLDKGTLLGAVRDGKFIPWDPDIDLASWHDALSDSTKISIAKELYERGLRVMIHQAGMYVVKDEVTADIWFHHLHNDKVLYLSAPNGFIGRRLYQFLSLLTAPHYYGVPKRGPVMRRILARFMVNTARAVPSWLRKRIAAVVAQIYRKAASGEIVWLWAAPSSYLRDLSTITFYGMAFRVPSEVEQYLANRYGEDWRIPKRDSWSTPWRTP